MRGEPLKRARRIIESQPARLVYRAGFTCLSFSFHCKRIDAICLHDKTRVRSNPRDKVKNAAAESFNTKVKAFRAQFRGVRDIPQGTAAGKYARKLLKAGCASYAKRLAPPALCRCRPSISPFFWPEAGFSKRRPDIEPFFWLELKTTIILR